MPESPFSSTSIAKAVHDTLDAATAAIPEGRSHALLFDGTYSQADGVSMRALYVQKTDSGWKVMLAGSYDGEQGIAGKVATAKSW